MLAAITEILERIKNLLISPAKEWQKISKEPNDPKTILLYWLLPLAGITLLAIIIGGIFSRMSAFTGIGFFFGMAIVAFIILVGIPFLMALIIKLLAPTFGGKSDFNRALALAAYSLAPVFVVGILWILPLDDVVSLMKIIFLIAFLYGMYILYCGAGTMTGVSSPTDLGFIITTVVVYTAIWALLWFVLFGEITGSMFGRSLGPIRISF